MYDTGKVLLGIVIFLLVVLSPLLYNLGTSSTAEMPELKLPPNGATECVLDRATMRATHMDMLNEWRDTVVRDGKRYYEDRDTGERKPMSLTLTCLQCHSNKEEFCDACHDYMGVAPYCWDCHVAWAPGSPVETGEVQ